MMRIKRSQNAQTSVDMDTVDGYHASDFISRSGDQMQDTLHTVSNATTSDAFTVNSGAFSRMQASIDGGATWKDIRCSGQPVPGLAGADMTGKSLLLKEVLSTVFPNVAPQVQTCSVDVRGAADETIGNYAYAKTHDIAGSSDGDLTDYQVKINVHYGDGTDGTPDASHVYLDGQTLSWPNDVRFTNNSGALLDFWIESCTGDVAVFWVKVDSIPSTTGATIKMYYGHAEDVGASDGKATFPALFDDFAGTTLDTVIWNAPGISNYYSVSDSMLTLSTPANQSGSNCASSKAAFGPGYAIEALTMSTHMAEPCYEDIGLINGQYWMLAYYSTSSSTCVYQYNNNTTNVSTPITNWAANVWHRVGFARNGTALQFFIDGSEFEDTTRYFAENAEIRIETATWSSTVPVLCLDWILARSYTPEEPTHGDWGARTQFNSAIYKEVTHAEMDTGTKSYVTVSEDAEASIIDTTASDFQKGTLSNTAPHVDNYTYYYSHSDATTAKFDEAYMQNINTASNQIKIQSGATAQTTLLENTTSALQTGVPGNTCSPGDGTLRNVCCTDAWYTTISGWATSGSAVSDGTQLKIGAGYAYRNAGFTDNMTLEFDLNTGTLTNTWGTIFFLCDQYGNGMGVTWTGTNPTIGDGVGATSNWNSTTGSETVRLTSNTFYRFKIQCNSSTNTVYYYINNVLKNTGPMSNKMGNYIGFSEVGGTGTYPALVKNIVIYSTSEGAKSLTATRISPSVTLPAGGSVQSSTVSWTQDTTNGSVAVQARISGGAWQACTSGSSIPGLLVDSACDSRVIQFRQILTASAYTASPTLSNLSVTITTASNPTTGIWTQKLTNIITGDSSSQLSKAYLTGLDADNTDGYDLYWNLQNKQEVIGDDYNQLSNFAVAGMTTGNTDGYKLYWDLTTINSEPYSHSDSTTAEFDAGSKSSVLTSGDKVILTDGWANGYKYRKSHVIASSGVELTNYQMKFTIYKGTGSDSYGTVYLNNNTQSWTGNDPCDIRFTNSSGTLLDYYIETANGAEAVIWVEIDSIPASGGATVYLYYGKASDTSASNGTNTFLFFDNFASGSFDAGKWTVTGSPTIVDDTSYPGATKAAIITPGNSIAGVKVDVHSYITEWYMKFNSFGGNGPRWGNTLKEDNANASNCYGLCIESHADGSIEQYSGWKRTCITENGGALTSPVAASWNTGIWYSGRYTTSAGSQRLEIDGQNMSSGDSSGDAWYARFTTGTWDSGNSVRIFRVWTRSYSTSEPSHAVAWGAETMYYPSSGTWTSPADTTSPSGTVTSSKISWTADTPANTSVTVEANVGGAGWQACTKDQAIPGFTASPTTIQLRVTLATSDNLGTPTLYDISTEATLTTYAGTYYLKAYKDAGMTQQVLEGSRATPNGAVTLSQMNSSGLSGSATIADTCGDTGTMNTMCPTIDIYSDSAKAHLVASGRLFNAPSGTVTLVAQNNSGIGGTITAAYSANDTDSGNVLSPGDTYVIPPTLDMVDGIVITGDSKKQLSDLSLTGLTADNTDDYYLYWDLTSAPEFDQYTGNQLSDLSLTGLAANNTLYWSLAATGTNAYSNTATYTGDFDAGTKSNVSSASDQLTLSSGSWANGYTYRKEHTITGSGDGAQTNYPMMFVIHRTGTGDNGVDVYLNSHSATWTSTAGTLKDIRFTNSSGANLDYWIENDDGSTSTVWVEIDSIPSGGATIYMYYGKSGDTGASNGASTFAFFDDFLGSSLDTTTNWTVSGTTPGVSGSAVTCATLGSYIYSKNTYSYPLAVDVLVKSNTNPASGYWGQGFGLYSNAPFAWQTKVSMEVYQTTGSMNGFVLDGRDTVRATSPASGNYYDSSYTLNTIKWLSGSSATWTHAGSVLGTLSADTNVPNGPLRIFIGCSSDGSNPSISVDSIRARKITVNEPVHDSWGSETQGFATSGTWTGTADSTTTTGTFISNSISWSEPTVPANTTLTVETNVNGAGWHTATNGAGIYGITNGATASPATIQVRVTLTGDGGSTPIFFDVTKAATIQTGGGAPVVSLYSDSGRSALVAQGSGYGGNTITLAQQNSSGITGSVRLVSYSADETGSISPHINMSMYSDAAKTQLVSLGTLIGATAGIVPLTAQNGSGMSGSVTLGYVGDDADPSNTIIDTVYTSRTATVSGMVTSSMITWVENLYTNTSINVHTSLDGGMTWQSVNNNDPVPGLVGRTAITPVMVMVTFNGDGNSTPSIYDITVYATLSMDQSADYLELSKTTTYTTYNKNTNFAANSGVQTTFTRATAGYDPQGASVAAGVPRYKLTNLATAVNYTTYPFHTYPGLVNATADDIYYKVTRATADTEWLCETGATVLPNTTYTASFIFKHDGVIPAIYYSFCSYQTGHHLVPCKFTDLGNGITLASATYTTDSSTVSMRMPDMFVRGTWTWFEFAEFQFEEGSQATSFSTGYGGMLIEEGTTNLIGSNAGFEAGSYAGWGDFSSYGGATYAATTEKKWEGSYSLKIVTTGAATGMPGVNTPYFAASPGTIYTASAMLAGTGFADGKVQIIIRYQNGGAIIVDNRYYVNGLTAGFQKFSFTDAAAPANTTQATVMFRIDSTAVGTLYIDAAQCEAKNGSTSYAAVGSPRNAESLSIPAYTNVLNRSHGTLEFWFRPSDAKPTDWGRLFSAGSYTTGPITQDNLSLYYFGYVDGSSRRYPPGISASMRDVATNGDRGPAITLSHAIDNSAWYYVALRWNFNGGTGEIRLSLRDTDGTVKHSSTTGLTITPQFSGLANIYFGSDPGSSKANCFLKDIRLSTVFRTDAEIETSANPLSPFYLDANTAAYLPCYGGTATNLCGTYSNNITATSTQILMPGGTGTNMSRAEDTQGEFQTGNLTNIAVPGNYFQVWSDSNALGVTGDWSFGGGVGGQGAGYVSSYNTWTSAWCYKNCGITNDVTIEFDSGVNGGTWAHGTFFFGCDANGNGMAIDLRGASVGNTPGYKTTSGWDNGASGSGPTNDWSGGGHVKLEMNGSTVTYTRDGGTKGTYSLNYCGGYMGVWSMNNGAGMSNLRIYKTNKTGVRYSPDWTVPSPAGGVTYVSSSITWTPTLNGGTITVETSTDNGASWQTATSGAAIGNLSGVITGKVIKCRQTMVQAAPSGSPLVITSPTISNITLSLNYTSSYPSSAQWQSAAITIPLESSISSGTISWTASTQGVGASTSYNIKTSVNGGPYYTVTSGSAIPGLKGLPAGSATVNVLVNMACASPYDGTPVISNNNITVVCDGYASSGYRISEPLDLSSMTLVEDSNISWNTNTPNNTSVGIYSSVDGGSSWYPCTNDSAIPGVASGMIPPASRSLLVKTVLKTADSTVTPRLHDISINVAGNGAVTLGKWGTDYSTTLSSTDDFTANKITNPSLSRASAGYDNSGNSYDPGAARFDSLISSSAKLWYDGFDKDSSSKYTITNLTGTIDYTIISGKLSANALGAGTHYGTVTTGCNYADVLVEATADTCEWGGLVARVTSSANGFYLCCVSDSDGYSTNSLTLYRWTGSTFTQIYPATGRVGISFTRGTTHKIGLRVIGDLIEGYFDGVCVARVRDSNVAGSGGCGFYLDMLRPTTAFKDLKVSRVVKSLLIEEATTNLFTIAVTDMLSNVTKTNSSDYMPFGVQSAKAVNNNQTSTSIYQNSGQFTCTSNTDYTVQAWAKTGSVQAGAQMRVVLWRSDYSSAISSEFFTPESYREYHIVGTGQLTTSGACFVSVDLNVPSGNTTDTYYVGGVQVEQKAFPTSLASGTRAADVMTVPAANILDCNVGTIECRVYVNDALKNAAEDRYIFAHRYSDDTRNIIALRHDASGSWTAWTSDISGRTSIISAADTLSTGWHHFAVRWSIGRLSLSIDGAEQAYAKAPYLPMVLSSYMNIGCWPTGSGWINTNIKDVRISNTYKSDASLLNACVGGMPLESDSGTAYLASFDGNMVSSMATNGVTISDNNVSLITTNNAYTNVHNTTADFNRGTTSNVITSNNQLALLGNLNYSYYKKLNIAGGSSAVSNYQLNITLNNANCVYATYAHSKQHTINGSSDGVLTDYAVKINVHKGSGTDGQPDASHVYLNDGALSWTSTVPNDLRFASSTTGLPLDYWIESSTATDAVVWIEVDRIPTTGTSFYICYGKQYEVSASNADNTFPLYDTFANGTASGTRWNWGGNGSCAYGSNGVELMSAAVGSNSTLTSKNSMPNNVAVKFSYRSYYYHVGDHGQDGPGEELIWAMLGPQGYNWNTGVFRNTWNGHDNDDLMRCYTGGGGGGNLGTMRYQDNATVPEDTTQGSSPAWSGWVAGEVRVSGSTITFFKNGSQVYTSSWTPISDQPFHISVEGHDSWDRQWLYLGVNLLWIRKYTQNEPTHGAWGTDAAPAFYTEDGNNIVYTYGNVQSDWDDIRFYASDNTTVVPYWIEYTTTGSNGNTASVWLKVPYIPASPGTATVYLYYGNLAVSSASSAFSVFDFYDDFGDNSLNGSKWTVSDCMAGGSVSESGGCLNVSGNGEFTQARATATVNSALNYPAILEYRIYTHSGNNTVYNNYFWSDINEMPNGCGNLWTNETTFNGGRINTNFPYDQWMNSTHYFIPNSYHRWVFSKDTGNTFYNGTGFVDVSGSAGGNIGITFKIGLGNQYPGSWGGNMNVDWIRVRKWMSGTLPSMTSSSVQTPTNTGTWTSDVCNISSLGTISTSSIVWTSYAPSGTSVTVKSSFDGVNWSVCNNGAQVPSMVNGFNCSGKYLYLNVTLTGTQSPPSTATLSSIIVSITPTNTVYGSWISAPLDIGQVKYVADSTVSWNCNVPKGASMVMSSSLNGADWQECVSGGSIPGLTPGMDCQESTLRFKAYLVGNGITAPSLFDLSLDVTSAYVIGGYRILPPISLSGLGTIAASGVYWSSSPPMGHISMEGTTGTDITIKTNRNGNGVPDNIAMPSWKFSMGSNTDAVEVARAGPGDSDYTVLTKIDGNGKATLANVSGARSATRYVAANNARTASIADGDFYCDGAADEVTINAAITSLPASGGIIQLSEGTFYLSGSVSLPSNVTLRGQGFTATSLYMIAYDEYPAIVNSDTTNGNSNISISDLQVGTAANATTPASISLTKASNFAIDNVDISGSPNNGIYLNNCSTMRLSNLTVHGCTKNGIMLTGASLGGSITSSVIYSNTICGVMVDKASFIKITGNTLHSNGSPAAVTVNVGSANVNVDGNAFYYNQRAVSMWGNYSTVSGNTMYGGAGGTQIWLAGATGTTISNNIVTGALTSGITASGTTSQACTITGNTIISSGANGMYLYLLTKSVVSGNVVYANGNRGIYVDSPATYNLISNNISSASGTATASTYENILISSATGSTVIGNRTFKGWSGNLSGWGYSMSGGNSTVIGNDFSLGGAAGIVWTDGNGTSKQGLTDANHMNRLA